MAAKFGTLAIHAGQSPDQWKCKAVIPPITTSTTYKQIEPGQPVSVAVMECHVFVICAGSVCLYW